MAATMTRREEAGMAESASGGLDEILARIDERFVRAEERTVERFARFEERTDERFDRVDEGILGLKDRLGRVEDRVEQFEVKTERQLGRIDGRFAQMEARFEHVDERMGKLSQGLVNGALILAGSIVASFAATLVLIATQL
jgi:predicted RNase H-like nuclease (RuvC/YqgF family)